MVWNFWEKHTHCTSTISRCKWRLGDVILSCTVFCFKGWIYKHWLKPDFWVAATFITWNGIVFCNKMTICSWCIIEIYSESHFLIYFCIVHLTKLQNNGIYKLHLYPSYHAISLGELPKLPFQPLILFVTEFQKQSPFIGFLSKCFNVPVVLLSNHTTYSLFLPSGYIMPVPEAFCTKITYLMWLLDPTLFSGCWK